MQLTTAWDKAALIADLKAKGVADAEKIAKDVVDTVFDWTGQSCALLAPTQPAYALGAVILPKVQELIDTGIDSLIAKV